MERICYTFDLKPGTENSYEVAHAQIWPSVVGAMREAGISNYSLFRRGLHVVAYGECVSSVTESMALLAANIDNIRWSEFIQQLMVDPVDENGVLLFPNEIWHLPD